MRLLVCACFSCAYVGSLYLVPAKARGLPRDHPTHIRYRMLAGAASSLLCALCSLLLLDGDLRLLGVLASPATNLLAGAAAALLMALFYAGSYRS